MANATKWDAPGLLAHLLENRPLPADFVDQVLRRPLAEDLHFDCKSWQLFEESEAREEVRRNAAAFANADGGVLLIGLRENRDAERKLMSLTQDGDPASELATPAAAIKWFSQTLENIKPWLTPPYRLSVIAHNDLPLISLAVARAPNLVWCMEGRRQRYYLRMGDQTLPAPDSLSADLITGRRARPIFEIVNAVASAGPSSRTILSLNVHLFLSNAGLIWVDEGVIGLVCYRYPASVGGWGEVRPALLAYINDEGGPEWLERADLLTQRRDLAACVPLTQREERFAVEVPVPANPFGPYRWRAIVYVLPRNSPPTIWQLELLGDSSSDSRPELDCRQLHDGEAGAVSLGPA